MRLCLLRAETATMCFTMGILQLYSARKRWLDARLSRPIRQAIHFILLNSFLWLGFLLVAQQADATSATYEHYVDERGIVHVTSRRLDPGPWTQRKLAQPLLQNGASWTASTDSLPAANSRARRFDPWILEAARLYQIPESLIRAVIHTESRFNPRAVSSVGAMGLMQLMPATAQYLGVQDAFDPRQNIYGGSKYLRLLANMFHGDMVLVVAAYFSGSGSVKKYGGVPPYAKVRNYVKVVLQRYYLYESQSLRQITRDTRPLARQIAGAAE